MRFTVTYVSKRDLWIDYKEVYMFTFFPYFLILMSNKYHKGTVNVDSF